MIALLAICGAVAAEALAVYVLAEWLATGFSGDERQALSAVAYIATGLGAFGLVRLLGWLNWRPIRSAITVAVVAYVVIDGALRLKFRHDAAIWDFSWMFDLVRDPSAALDGKGAVLLSIVLLIALWARCVHRAADDLDLEGLPRAVSVPFALVTIIVVLSPYGDSEGVIGRGAAAFYAVAVVTLAFSQLALSGATFGDLRAGGVAATLIGLTIGATIGCVALFWLVFGIVAPVLGPFLLWCVEVIFFILAYPIAWVLQEVLGRLFSGGHALPTLTPPSPLAPNGQESSGGRPSGWELGAVYTLRTLGVVILLAAIAGAIAWFARIRRRVASRTSEAIPTALAGAFTADLRSALRHLRPHRRERTQGAGESAVRRLYAEVLAAGARVGTKRTPSETPAELAPRLEAALSAPATRAITAAFEASRYGDREPAAGETAALRKQWEAERRAES